MTKLKDIIYYLSLTFKRHQSSGGVPCKDPKEAEQSTAKLDKETIRRLERLALVDFGNEEGIKRLESAIRFAQKLKDFKVDESVEPMYTVLEKRNLRLREDKVTDGNCRNEVLKNASVVEEDYFVAPQRNVPYNKP